MSENPKANNRLTPEEIEERRERWRQINASWALEGDVVTEFEKELQEQYITGKITRKEYKQSILKHYGVKENE